jgi:hypothetical protein
MAQLVSLVNTTFLNIFQKWTGSTSLPFWRDVWNSSTDDIREKVLLRGYCQGMLDRATVEEVLEIGRSRFLALLKEYRRDTDIFSIAYQRESLTIDSLSG